MQKFEITQGQGTTYHMALQCKTSDLAKIILAKYGVQESDIKVYFLDESLCEQARPYLQNQVEYYCDHQPDGSVHIKQVSDDATVLEVPATLKGWDELYGTDDNGKEVYLGAS